jgi:hypothetical protein
MCESEQTSGILVERGAGRNIEGGRLEEELYWIEANRELGGVMNILFELIWLGKGAVLSIMLGVSVDSFNVFIPLF